MTFRANRSDEATNAEGFGDALLRSGVAVDTLGDVLSSEGQGPARQIVHPVNICVTNGAAHEATAASGNIAIHSAAQRTGSGHTPLISLRSHR